MLLQLVVVWSSVRWRWFRDLVKSEPALLVRRGEILPHALRRERISEDEVLAAVRAQGYAALSDIDAVVLETDGSFSVIPRRDGGSDASALSNVRVPE